MADYFFYCNSFASASGSLERVELGKRVVRPALASEDASRRDRESQTASESRHARRPSTASSLNVQPPRLVQPCRAIGRTDCAGRSPDRGRARARHRRRRKRPVADGADAALRRVRNSGGPARRPFPAALADGRRRSRAGVGLVRHPALDLVRPADATPARDTRLHRRLRDGRLQCGRTGAGAFAGDAERPAGSQRPDRTRTHDCLCRRACDRRVSRGLAWRGTGLWMRRRTVGDCGGAAFGNFRTGAGAGGRLRGRCLRVLPLRGACLRRAAAPYRRSGKAPLSCCDIRCCGRSSSPSSSSTPRGF